MSDVRDSTNDLDGEAGFEFVHDELEKGGARPGLPAPVVAMTNQLTFDRFARGRRNVGPTVEHLRDRRERDPGFLRDRGKSHSSSGLRRCHLWPPEVSNVPDYNLLEHTPK